MMMLLCALRVQQSVTEWQTASSKAKEMLNWFQRKKIKQLGFST